MANIKNKTFDNHNMFPCVFFLMYNIVVFWPIQHMFSK